MTEEQWARKRAYMVKVCPPTVAAPAGPAHAWDARREEFRSVAVFFFQRARPHQFRSWLERHFQRWRCSPTALFLVGNSHFYEQEFERVEGYYKSACDIWDEMKSINLLSKVQHAWIINSVIANRALLQRAAGKPDEAMTLLSQALEEVFPLSEDDSPELAISTRSLWLGLFRAVIPNGDDEVVKSMFNRLGATHVRWKEDESLVQQLCSAREFGRLRRLAKFCQEPTAATVDSGQKRAEGVQSGTIGALSN